MNILEQYRQAKLIEAAQAALKHVSELREAWQRGIIHESDNQGGTRSNKNASVETQLRKALKPFKTSTSQIVFNLRAAGGDAWDEVDDVDKELAQLRDNH